MPPFQFDLVGGRVDFEKEITSVDDIAVLETDLSQGAADLRAQLKMVHGRELAQKSEPAVHVTLQRRADDNLRWRWGNGSIGCLYEQTSCEERGAGENNQRERQADPDSEARLP
jgi:hypothetical protein